MIGAGLDEYGMMVIAKDSSNRVKGNAVWEAGSARLPM